MVNVDLSGAESFFDNFGPDYNAAAQAHKTLSEKTGPGNDYIGWVNLPETIKNRELKRLVSTAQKIRSRSKFLVVIGIGGSYLGARGAIELLKPSQNSYEPKVIFVGNGLSPDALNRAIQEIGDDDFDINVISKSGTTLEPAISFRIFRALCIEKYGSSAKKHIFATTDAHKGILKSLAETEGWETFIVPDDVGGRFSVLSAVGLLPMAVAGIDIKKVINTAIEEFKALDLRSPENPAWKYAASRQHLYSLGKKTEILAYYEPSFRFMAEWWKQLYGESEGKNGIGIFPASVEFTADLHSMGQFIQDGTRDLMETIVRFDKFNSDFTIPFEMGDADGLNYLAGKDLGQVCSIATDAVKSAHISGGVPNIEIHIPAINEAGFASMVCFFEMACAISAYMAGVNPFNQPGVEAYKKKMFYMLGKPST